MTVALWNDKLRGAFIELTALVLMTTMAASQTITVDSIAPAPDVSPAIIMPIHCDARGNVFLQPPLSKIDRDGKRPAVFDLSAARSDGLVNLVFKAFAVDPGGSLYQLTRMADQGVAIVKFDSEGHYVRSLLLDQKFEPQQLGVFAGDTFLVAGIALVKGGPNPQFSQYLALFDRSGRLVKTIDTLEATDGIVTGHNKGDSKPESPANLSGLPELGIVESDGVSVYLLKQGSAPTIIVLSPAGVIDRMLKLSPPQPDTNVSGFRVGSGQLLVEYARPEGLPNGNTAYYLVLYDSQTGDKLSEYSRDPALGGILGCADWRGNFTLLSTDKDGKRVLIKASAR